MIEKHQDKKFNLDWLVQNCKLKITGIIHVGASSGQEFQSYVGENIENIVLIEPLPSAFNALKKNVGDSAILINMAVGNRVGNIKMFVSSNDGRSSSVLNPKVHLSHHPEIKFTNNIVVKINKLENIILNPKLYNLLVLDIQGYELEVLKGSKNILHHFDYILTEVNKVELYENGVLIEEIDQYLGKRDYLRVQTTWCGGVWGDALYIKKQIYEK
jgi:FkbM family methyltransferase